MIRGAENRNESYLYKLYDKQTWNLAINMLKRYNESYHLPYFIKRDLFTVRYVISVSTVMKIQCVEAKKKKKMFRTEKLKIRLYA